MAKVEPRGKYAGVKVHLDGEESKLFLAFVKQPEGQHKFHLDESDPVIKLVSKLGKKIKKLQFEVPTLLEDRTEEEIKKTLLRDQAKIKEQLDAIEAGQDWKQV